MGAGVPPAGLPRWAVAGLCAPRRTRSVTGMELRTTRTVARLIAWGRISIGCTALVAPVPVTRPWVGDAAESGAAKLLARTMGGRDLALGVGTLRALGVSDAEGRPWVALGGVADTVDLLATVIAFSQLPRRSRWGILALTSGAALVSIRAAITLDAPGP